MLLLGDLNFDFLSETKSTSLKDFMDLYGFDNQILQPNFFLKDGQSLLDVILINNQSLIKTSGSLDPEYSDGHSLIYTIMKEKCILKSSRYITYRSNKEYVRDDFITDLEQTPLHICNIFNDPGDSLWAFQSMFVEVLNNHAPVEEKRIRSHEPPFMNSKLRKVVRKNARLLKV